MFSFVISINSTHAGGCARQAKVSAYAAWRQTSCHGRGGEEGLGLKRSCCSSIRELVVRQGKDMRGDWLWVAIGSGKSMERGSTFWQIALSHRDCLQVSCFFCVCRELYNFCSVLKRFIFRQWTGTREFFLLGIRLVCDFQTIEVFTSFMQLLFADLPSADW